ncbi:MAG TPA: energy transducer TonB [Pyrinomonadaceae bacterium]|jgi:TonB family protein
MSKFQRTLLLIGACLLLTATHTVARAQSSPPQSAAQTPGAPALSVETAQGIELYKQGDFQAAAAQLKKATKQTPTDADAWHYLGLALAQLGKQSDATSALQKGVYLRFARLNSFTVGDKKPGELTKEERGVFNAELLRRYRLALETVTAYLQLNPKDAAFWREQEESLQFYIAHGEGPSGQDGVHAPQDLTTRAVLLSKPNPKFPTQARNRETQGEVVLRAVLAADGTVQHVLVLKPLPDGLMEASAEAARQVTFRPAEKNGQPVSQLIMLSYHFGVR